MADTQQQMKSVLSRMEERDAATPENRERDIEMLKETASDVAETFTPYGDYLTGKEAVEDFKRGDYGSAALGAAATAIGLIPGVGDVVAKGIQKTRKAYKLFVKGEDGELYPLFVNADTPIKQGEFLEADFPDVAFKGKRKEGSEEKYYVPTKGAKRSKGEKAKKTGDPIIIPDEETRKKLIEKGFITERTGRTKEAPYGKVTAVAARPGWHASQAPVATHLGPQDLKITKKEAEKLLEAGVTPEAIKRKGNQFYVKRRAEDQVYAVVEMADDVDYQSMLAKEGRSDINDYVPKGGSYRYSDGQADSDQWVVGGDMKVDRVLSREETRQLQKEMGVVDLPYRDEVEAILKRKFSEGGVVMDDYIIGKTIGEESMQKFAEGGTPMPIKQQMSMFKEGGLNHEGGTKDPVSGNDVPLGSTQKEVRDDIPAMLSEGEYVIPADVVRFYGIKFFEELRMGAKEGMQLLDAKGQMGNGDEQIVPDDVPFDLEDLEMDDTPEFNEGGVVYAKDGIFVDKALNPVFNAFSSAMNKKSNNQQLGTNVSNMQSADSGYQYKEQDAAEALKYTSGIKTADQAALDLYDLNKDGKIDISDTIAVTQKAEEEKGKATQQVTQPEYNVETQTERAFGQAPTYYTPTAVKPKLERQSFSQLISPSLLPTTPKKTVEEPKEEEPVDEKLKEEAKEKEEIIIGAEGSDVELSDEEKDALGISDYGFNAYTGAEVSAADVTAIEQSMSALAGFTQGFTNDIGYGLRGALSVVGALGVGKAAGIMGKIGGTLNNAAAIYATAQQMGLNVSVLDAVQAAAIGFYDSTLGKQMTTNKVEFDKAVVKAKNSAVQAVVDAGFLIDPTTGTVIDDMGVPAFPDVQAAKAFYSQYGLLLDKTERAALKEKALNAVKEVNKAKQNNITLDITQVEAFQSAAKDSALKGVPLDVTQIAGYIQDNTTQTSTPTIDQAVDAISSAIAAEAAMSGQESVAEPSTSAVQADDPLGPGYGFDEDSAPPDQSIDAPGGYDDEGLDPGSPDAIGGYDDEGLGDSVGDGGSDSDSPGAEGSDPGGAPGGDASGVLNKGGFILKRKTKTKSKRKGLAARK